MSASDLLRHHNMDFTTMLWKISWSTVYAVTSSTFSNGKSNSLYNIVNFLHLSFIFLTIQSLILSPHFIFLAAGQHIPTSFHEFQQYTEFADGTLACEGNQMIEAHKVILSASSDSFRDILNQTNHSHPLIYMRGMKAKDLVSVVDFCLLLRGKYLPRKPPWFPWHCFKLLNWIFGTL